MDIVGYDNLQFFQIMTISFNFNLVGTAILVLFLQCNKNILNFYVHQYVTKDYFSQESRKQQEQKIITKTINKNCKKYDESITEIFLKMKKLKKKLC